MYTPGLTIKIIRPYALIWVHEPRLLGGNGSLLLNQDRNTPLDIHEHLERCGRIAYRSESKGDSEAFVSGIVRRNHESVLEHAAFTLDLVIPRWMSHELVRHRHTQVTDDKDGDICVTEAALDDMGVTQQSQRYVNYGGAPIQFVRHAHFTPTFHGVFSIDGGRKKIKEYFSALREILDSPSNLHGPTTHEEVLWLRSCFTSANKYERMLQAGSKPQIARDMLNNAAATRVMLTMSVRQLRALLRLRCHRTAHPTVVAMFTEQVLRPLETAYPVLFSGLREEGA